jgi:hypothetical protein
MMAADPLGHLAHGMAQNTPEPTFAGKSLDQVVKEAMEPVPTDLRGLEEERMADKVLGVTPAARRKGGRPRKA